METDLSSNHPVGTCAIINPELGGILSPELVVDGTQNVRVAFSFQTDRHLTRYKLPALEKTD